ncbi:hypothetical protein ACN28E_24160 [Archangium lansingense]|uniref:hypothetical protein n=1 Tax=Archangium lansingense TaxID=2995310 RepID=UPI003B7CB4A7
MTNTTRRKLRHTVARWLLLTPLSLLAACGQENSCDSTESGSGSQQDRWVTVPPRFQFSDGSTVGPDTTCEQLCSALSSYTEGEPCRVESRDSASVPTEVTCRLPDLCAGRSPQR